MAHEIERKEDETVLRNARGKTKKHEFRPTRGKGRPSLAHVRRKMAQPASIGPILMFVADAGELAE